MAASTEYPPDTEADIIDYYDIMVIGRTGMGKSTTSDKLIIANPDGHDYRGEQHPDEEIVNEDQMQMSDLCVWLVPDGAEDEVKRHLKDLIMARSLDKPHEEVTNIYKESNVATTRCQVFSNETTKTRVLDVPGFFGEDFSGKPKQDTANKVTITGVRIMREILRIQALLRMHFRRIIYFIPERGPLERPHKVLQMELEQMLHYFGKAIFNCMILVATQPANVYKYIPPDQVPFSDEDHVTTRDNFVITLRRALSEDDGSADNAIPPIVFISMRDSCEEVMKKVKEASVISQQLTIPFECQACSRCGLKAKWLRNKENKKVKIACYAGEDPSLSIPYEESRCHPMIVPKYYEITKIIGGIAHVITRRKYIGNGLIFTMKMMRYVLPVIKYRELRDVKKSRQITYSKMNSAIMWITKVIQMNQCSLKGMTLMSIDSYIESRTKPLMCGKIVMHTKKKTLPVVMINHQNPSRDR